MAKPLEFEIVNFFEEESHNAISRWSPLCCSIIATSAQESKGEAGHSRPI